MVGDPHVRLTSSPSSVLAGLLEHKYIGDFKIKTLIFGSVKYKIKIGGGATIAMRNGKENATAELQIVKCVCVLFTFLDGRTI
jgi:hypothetical protein